MVLSDVMVRAADPAPRLLLVPLIRSLQPAGVFPALAQSRETSEVRLRPRKGQIALSLREQLLSAAEITGQEAEG